MDLACPRYVPSTRDPTPPAISKPARARPNEEAGRRRHGRRRWPWIVGALALALIAFFALFDWNLLRGPAERFASNSTGRTVTIGHLDVRWHWLTPQVVLTDMTIGNPEWGGSDPMGRAGEVMFNVRLMSLLTRNIVIPHLRLKDAEVNFMRDSSGRSNWRFREGDQKGKRNVQVLTLALDNASVGLGDDLHNLSIQLHGFTRKEAPYETRIGFAGTWHTGTFEGTADTGSILSLRGSTQPFPIRIVGRAGKTNIRAEGEVADVTRFRHIDADFAINGPSLASLYPVLGLALPDTPPYQARGRLKRDDSMYAYENFTGKIGASDIAGTARYELRKPRPILSADLRSQTLALADLGPVVGLQSRGTEPGSAKRAVDASGGKIFPDHPFNLEKLNSMDGDVKLAATHLRLPEQVPLENFKVHAKLDAGVLNLDPMTFGFAGGDIVSKVVLDARNDPIAADISADFKRVKLSELLPTLDKVKQSGGSLGAQVRLKGRGNSVAAMMGTANGTVAAGMAGGRVSELAVWLVNLNGGELIPLLFGGDRPTPVRCAAAAMDVNGGVGTIGMFVFDTEESRITADGNVDFRNERLDVTLRPEAKKPGLLSIRGPIHIHGPFRKPAFAVAPQSIARGVGAIALGLVNPLLALVPLVETGGGQDANCAAVLAPVKGALAQSGKSAAEAPAKGEPARREDPAPIVNVPANKATASRSRDGTVGLEQKSERQPPAPIVDVPPKK